MEIDFQPVQDAISFAGDTGSAVQKLAGALETIKSLFGSAKVGADPDIKLAMSEMAMQVANTQYANAQLTQRLISLETALKTAQAIETDFDRYELWKAPTGRVVYRLKESDDTGEPDHFLCPNCIETKRKSILQGDWLFKCFACGSRFEVASPPTRERSDKWMNR